MPAKNSRTIAFRVSDRLKERLEAEMRRRDFTLAKLAEAFVIASEGEEVDFVDGCICSKGCEAKPIEHDRIHRNLERFIEVLEDKGYPESFIIQATEQILEGAKVLGRYNPRRSKVFDAGC